MCDQDSFHDMLEHLKRNDALTRRRFGALSVGAGLLAALPRPVNAAEVVEQEVEIKTSDGVADAHFVHPAQGKAPAVLVWTDIFGLRPAFRQMGRRLAESGYAVLTPNPFYRTRRAPTTAPGANLQDEATRNAVMAMARTLSPETHVSDAQAFIGWLDGQAAVDSQRKMGTTGYCMGGAIVMRTAGNFPDRVGAGAAFHSGPLVTDKPDSPHLLVPKMKAHLLIAIAANDDERDPNAKRVLRETCDQAKVPAEIEVYAGTKHGWCPPDAAVYDETQAERAWQRLLVTLRAGVS
ncbi:MAG: dienelactone hydrolase family protein [Steroidobacteraceae bacterium]|nr:dienelactone hydrolase family protein [Nevskiaceae bacterium]MCP5339354.1 dienelactone hydrolase family protein [Nevskiaceae bacterium]MCP5466537.1 dienelactone hydrolase family protein [Nevskiaceae bacterium]MCP5471365.1 dienelactone hydrolase family protein [Nevskiaceae bacterium]